MTTIEDTIRSRNNNAAITAALGGFVSSSLSIYLFSRVYRLPLGQMTKVYTIAGTTLACAIWGKNISRTPKALDMTLAIPLSSAPILGLWLAHGPSKRNTIARFAIPLLVLGLVSAAIPWATAQGINELVKIRKHNDRIFIWNGPQERKHFYLLNSLRVFKKEEGGKISFWMWNAQKLEWIPKEKADIKASNVKIQLWQKKLTYGSETIDLSKLLGKRVYTQVEETDKEVLVTIFNGEKSLLVTFAN